MRKAKEGKEFGAAMIETAISLPLLLFIAFELVNLGQAMHVRMAASRVAYEAARFGASLPSLEEGKGYVTNGEGQKSAQTVHLQLRTRLIKLLKEENNQTKLLSHPLTFTTEREGNIVRITAKVQASSVYKGIIGMDSIQVSAEAPYLYKDE